MENDEKKSGSEVLDDSEKTTEVKTSNDSDNNKKKKGNGLLIFIIIFIIVLFIIGFAIVLLLLLPKNSEKTKKIDTNKTETKSEYRLTSNSLENFDLYFLQLENTNVNKVYSPLSIKYALAMLQQGAKGQTKEQITNIIGDYKAKSYPNNNHMSFANAMFIRNTFKVNEDYITNIKNNYNAEVISDDFTSPDNVNNWVSNKTFNLINNLVNDVSSNDFVLINALAIDMNWNNRIQYAFGNPDGLSQIRYNVNYVHEKYSDYVPIIENDNYPKMKFNDNDNIKSVIVGASFNHYDIITDKGEDNIRKTVGDDYNKYLQENPDQVSVCPSVDDYLNDYIKEIETNYKKADISTDFYVSDTETEKVFAKDLQTYDGITLQYVGIMPKTEKLADYVKNTDAKKISNVIKNMKEVKYESFKDGVVTKIKGSIPLFKYEYELKLEDDLKSLGIKNVFDINKSDLSLIVDKEKEAVSPAIHKANIEFSNDGIKAAAATAIGGLGSARACNYDYEYEVPVEEIDVTFDKPYMYVIRDKESGEVWFVGTVYEPIVR